MGRSKKSKTTSVEKQEAKITELSEGQVSRVSTPTSPEIEQPRMLTVGDTLNELNGLGAIEKKWEQAYNPAGGSLYFSPTSREPRKVVYMDELLNCLNKIDAAWRPIIEGQDAKIDQMGVFIESQLQINAAFNSKFIDLSNLAEKLSTSVDRILSNLEGQVSISATLRADINDLQVQAQALDRILKENGIPLSQRTMEEQLTAMMKKKEASFDEMAIRLHKLEEEWTSQPQVDRGQIDELTQAFEDHAHSLKELKAQMRSYGKSEDYSQKLDGHAMRMSILEEQLEKMAGFEKHSNRLIEENNAKLESIQGELRGIAQLQAAANSSRGKKPMEVNEGRPKPKKIRQVWVRKAWVPCHTLDLMERKEDSSFLLDGKPFKWVKPCDFPARRVKKPPSLGVWN